jgi:dihydrofolate reductase
MGELILAMNLSLDGYVAGEEGELDSFRPSAELFSHFTNLERGLAGSLYGRRVYEVMRYWDEDRPEWDALQYDFAAAWRAHRKWVVSSTLKSVGANATLVNSEIEAFVRSLKENVAGQIAVAGPQLAGSLTDRGLIDEYHLYFRPIVLGRGKPYFAGARPPLRLVSADRVSEDAVRIVLALDQTRDSTQ